LKFFVADEEDRHRAKLKRARKKQRAAKAKPWKTYVPRVWMYGVIRLGQHRPLLARGHGTDLFVVFDLP
jgi:hypothetical protein